MSVLSRLKPQTTAEGIPEDAGLNEGQVQNIDNVSQEMEGQLDKKVVPR